MPLTRTCIAGKWEYSGDLDECSPHKTHHYTPGPWSHAKRGDYDTRGIGIFAKNEAGLPYYVATAGFMGTADYRFAEANAQLIASAPELLSALKALHSCHRAFSESESWTTLDDGARELAEAAIAKAEGNAKSYA